MTPSPRPMPIPFFSPLFGSIIARHNLPVADEAEIDALARSHEHVMLVLMGDAERLAECDDVAVIVPELAKTFAGILTPVVAARTAERALQRLYRFSAFPALVLLRDGQYLGAIAHVRDWSDYLREIPEILGRQPSDPPPFKIPTRPARVEEDGADEHLH